MTEPNPITPDRADDLAELVDELDDRAREEQGDPLGRVAAEAEPPSPAATAEPSS